MGSKEVTIEPLFLNDPELMVLDESKSSSDTVSSVSSTSASSYTMDTADININADDLVNEFPWSKDDLDPAKEILFEDMEMMKDVVQYVCVKEGYPKHVEQSGNGRYKVTCPFIHQQAPACSRAVLLCYQLPCTTQEKTGQSCVHRTKL